jgi:hypothetical protein
MPAGQEGQPSSITREDSTRERGQTTDRHTHIGAHIHQHTLAHIQTNRQTHIHTYIHSHMHTWRQMMMHNATELANQRYVMLVSSCDTYMEVMESHYELGDHGPYSPEHAHSSAHVR